MRIVSVRELTGYIKERLESDPFLARVWVRGEVTSCTYHPSGHVYFGLQDQAARSKVVMFRSQVSRMSVRLKNGMVVVVRGHLGVYEPGGQYQLYAQAVDPDGAGALHEALERLKEQLQREGLFDAARKRPMPALPRTVGLVTSPVGAAVKDILTVLGKRWPLAGVILAPVAVQGETAPYEIAQAIRLLNGIGGIDVIIVGRGGGASEELGAFNTELVARALFASHVPVVSAVGHEKDVTISDLVADLRAPTPSAAAEMIVPDQRVVVSQLENLQSKLGRAMRHHLTLARLRLDLLARQPALAKPSYAICERRRENLNQLEARLRTALERRIGERKTRLAGLAGRLQALSPLEILARGFSICQRADGQVLREAAEVLAGERVTVRLRKGRLRCLVEETYLEEIPGTGKLRGKLRGQGKLRGHPT